MNDYVDIHGIAEHDVLADADSEGNEEIISLTGDEMGVCVDCGAAPAFVGEPRCDPCEEEQHRKWVAELEYKES